MANQIVFWTLLALLGVSVTRWGGAPERLGFAVLGVGSVMTVALGTADVSARFQSAELGIFAVDVVVLGAFLFLALKAERFWPLWVTGFHIIGLTTHAAKMVGPDVVPWAYAVGQALWAYPIMAAIALGTVRHRQRLARFGADKSWTTS